MNSYDEFPDVPPYMLDGVEDTDSSVVPDPDIDEVIEELHKDDDLPSGDDDDLVEDTSDEEEEEFEDEEDSSDED